MNSIEAARIDKALLGAPCTFCKYNGPGFFQAGTHKKSCPWHHIGGYSERIDFFVEALEERRIKVFYGVHSIDEFYKE